MASFVNGCVFTATSSGTGSFVVSAAVTGWQTPAQAGASNGATYRYRAYSADNTQWEIGSGVYTTGTVTLTRAVIEASTNGGAAVNFTAAPAVALTMFDEDFVNTGTLGSTTSNLATRVLGRTASFTNTGSKEPSVFRADLTDADFTNGVGTFQSLVQLGTSSTPTANTDWPQLGPIDAATFSGWVLNWGATPTTKQPIAGNFGIAFENVSTDPAYIQWAMELDVGNYTGTSAAGDERYGVGLKLNAFGAVDSPATEAIGVSRPASANSGTGWLVGLHVDGARTTGYKFEAMTEVGSGYALESMLGGDTVHRFALDYAGALLWGPGGSSAVDIALYRGSAGALYQDGNEFRVRSTDASAAEGPILTLYRDSASPAAADITGAVVFDGEDDGGTKRRFGTITDVTGSANIFPLGVSTQGALGSILIWNPINPDVPGNWVPVPGGPGGGWVPVDVGPADNWTPVAT